MLRHTVAVLLMTGSSMTTACASSPVVTGEVPRVSSTASSTPPSDPESPASVPPDAPRTALAAARSYIDAYDLAAQTGDTSDYDLIVAPGCPCREPFLTSFVGSLRAHHWHTDARRVITSVRLVRAAGAAAIVDVAFCVAAYHVLDARGAAVLRGAPDRAVLRISLVRSDARWIVADAVRR